MKTPLILLTLAALLGHSQAAVIYSGVKDILIPTTFIGVYIDVDGGGTVAEEGAGWDVNFIFNGEGIANSPSFQPVATTIALDAPVMNLAPGVVVSPSSTVATTRPHGYSSSESHIANNPGQFISGNEGYIGFRFTTNDNSGPYYGWMRVVLSNTSATGLVRDWAYDNTGSSITVGVIPEPSTTLALLLAASSFCFRRRK